MSSWVYAISFGVETAYWVMALSATILFIIKVLLVVFGGDFDSDADMDAGGDMDHGSSGTFAVFSLQSILAFFMGAGWMGLAALKEWGFSTPGTFMVALIFGVCLMLLNAGLMFAINKLNAEVKYDIRSAIGHVCKVYLVIPKKGDGTGQVEVTVSGRRMIMRAISEETEIATGALVKVTDVKDGQILVVTPQD